MFADTCKILSILAVIWFRNKGLTLGVTVFIAILFWFTRHVQKNMLTAQIENRRAVGRARQVMCRRRFKIFGRSIALEKKNIWKSGMTKYQRQLSGDGTNELL